MAVDGEVAKASSTPPESGPEGPQRRRTSRKPARRWLRRAALAISLLSVALLVLVWLVAENLEHPWIKRRLLALVKERAGLDIDYTGLELSFTRGLRARELRLLAPPRAAEHVDTVLRVENLALEVRPWALLWGERAVDALRADRVELTLVRDASGIVPLKEQIAPERPAPEAQRTRPSQLLSRLPRAALHRLEVSRIQTRLIDLRESAPRREVVLSGLGVSGTLRSGDRGLEGSDVVLRGAPLELLVSEGDRVTRAQLPSELRIRALDAESVTLGVRVVLGEQDVAPGWQAPRELLELEGAARFDAGAGQATIEIERLRALDGAVSARLRADAFDAEGLRVVSSGAANLRIETLPSGPWPIALDGLALDVSTDELSWDGARVAGAITTRGQVRGVELKLTSGGRARLSTAALSGDGSFDGVGGSFRGALTAAGLEAHAPEWAVELGPITVGVDGTAVERAGAQYMDARSSLELASGRASSRDGASVELGRSSANARLSDLTADAAAPLGARGAAQLSLSVPLLRSFERRGQTGGAAARRESASLRGVELRAQLPLTLHDAAGTLSIAALFAEPNALRDLELTFETDDSLAWAGGAPGVPRAIARGRLGRFDLGGSHGTLEAFNVAAERPQPDRYRLELGATAAALGARGRALPGRVRAELAADAAPEAGTLALRTELRGERGVEARVALDARFERSSERLTYHAELGARELDALAAFGSGLTQAAPFTLGEARVRAVASGDLRGVLRAQPGLLPAASSRPLATARGSHRLGLELEGLRYRGQSGVLEIPALGLELGSVHGARGSGSTHARLRAESIRLEGGGRALHVSGVDQQLGGRFERPPDEGTIELRTALALDAAEQSWLPSYPVRDARLSSRIDIERLRSIFLRELALENPVAGTALRATAALEIRPQADLGGETLAQRQALSLEGRLEQDLAALAPLGLVASAEGKVAVPFRIESGGLLAYRVQAALEARDVSVTSSGGSLSVERLNGAVPVIEEFVLLPGGLQLGPARRANPLADLRFFDVHPFVTSPTYVTADAITIAGAEVVGPLAANVRVERSSLMIDQLQAGYRGGQIVGRLGMAYRDRDPIVKLRLNATGVRSQRGEVLDANAALTFLPLAMSLDGKVQLVRASRDHVRDILSLLDPFHESVPANRVRRALAFGYPKFVRFQLRDGAVKTKIELGGIASALRIDAIPAIPTGPLLERYVAPALAPVFEKDSKPPASDQVAKRAQEVER